MSDTDPSELPTYDNCDEVSDSCPVEATIFGTRLTQGANGAFAALFVALFLAQLWFGIRSRTWSFTVWFSLGTGLEIIGYLARVYLARNPWSLNGFIAQYLALLLAPTLVAAAISVTFKHLVIWYGAQWSVLRPRLYPVVFVGTDFLSIFVQIIGGGLVATNAAGEGSETTQKVGEACVIGGVAFQVANMMFCAGLMLLFARRRKVALRAGASGSLQSDSQSNLWDGAGGRYAPPKGAGAVPRSRKEASPKEAVRTRWFTYALGVAYVAIIIRCGYRIAETIPSISVDVMRNEALFLCLDGAMLLVAIGAVTLIHPHNFFPFLGLSKKARNESRLQPGHEMPYMPQQLPPPQLPPYQQGYAQQQQNGYEPYRGAHDQFESSGPWQGHQEQSRYGQ